MRTLLRAFKKHYLRTKDVYGKLHRTGSFTYRSKVTQTPEQAATVQAELITPDQDLTVRFVVLMRKFLNPRDRLYYKHVWATLREQFVEEIPTEVVSGVEAFIADLNQGYISINYNDEVLTPESIYRKIAEGEYFNRDAEHRTFLEGLASVPMIGPLFWHQFYEYTTGGLVLASKLFDVIQMVETTEKYKRLYGDPANIVKRCVYCLTTFGEFTAEEHIFPEAMGNYDKVLPRGYVCDRCNNGVLSLLDRELSDSMLFAWQRVDAVEYTKQGKLPEAHFEGATLRKTKPMNVLLRAEPGSDAIKVVRELNDGQVELAINLKGKKKFDERSLTRTLCKVGLGMVAFDFGQDYACSSRYDAVRRFIREGYDFRNNLLLCTKFVLDTGISAQYQMLPEGTPIEFHIFGVILMVNLEEQPLLELNDETRQVGFISFPLHGVSTWQHFDMEMVDPSYFVRR